MIKTIIPIIIGFFGLTTIAARAESLKDRLSYEAAVHEQVHTIRNKSAAGTNKKTRIVQAKINKLGLPFLPHDWAKSFKPQRAKQINLPKNNCQLTWPQQLSRDKIRGFALEQFAKGRAEKAKLLCLVNSLNTDVAAAANINAGLASLQLLNLPAAKGGQEIAEIVAISELRNGNYPEVLRAVFGLAANDKDYRQVYKTIQRAYALFQKGGGAVALKAP